jgi:hypothetical protein
MKIRRVRAELFHSDRLMGGWTGRNDETNSSFSKFCDISLNIEKGLWVASKHYGSNSHEGTWLLNK